MQGLASAVTNGPLTALAGGGVYAYGSANPFPSDSYNASNYWVDVVYSTLLGPRRLFDGAADRAGGYALLRVSGSDGHSPYHGNPLDAHVATGPWAGIPKPGNVMKGAMVGLAASARVTTTCAAARTVISSEMTSTPPRWRSGLRPGPGGGAALAVVWVGS